MSDQAKNETFTNRLINETSPYLLQHAHNPVDWYPWSTEAFERARAENKPVLLSVGYAACHWCHVMERESFENDAIAKLMNDNFVNIKVDREERPDVDSIYMTAVQLMTGHGGWPMTVFLTPDQIPFYGGTYYPPEDRHGMPGFPRILISIAEAYHTRGDEIAQNAGSLLAEINRVNSVSVSAEGALDEAVLERCTNQLMRVLDPAHGGFGSKPKFPPSMSLEFLLRQYKRTGDSAVLAAVDLTLEKMAHGGIYDQLGGGFHRYSVDERWLVPHFEKMLYDNALLSKLYVDAWVATKKPLYRRIAEETLDYVRRDMTNENGGFYSTEDADSEGVEGKFFVWTTDEVEALLGKEDAELFCRYFDITPLGNFEESNILHIDVEVDALVRLLRVTPEKLREVIERGRNVLFETREKRVRPGLDDKILTSWNALMLKSFAEAGSALSSPAYIDIARRNAEFLLNSLSHRTEGALRLLRTHKNGKSRLNGYLEDYAYLADAFLSLYAATFEIRWFDDAVALVKSMIDNFWDDAKGAFYFTSGDHESLITRTVDVYDNATPSGNSVAAEVLLKLSLLTGKKEYRSKAERILTGLKDFAVRSPNGFGRFLCAMDLAIGPAIEIAVIGDPQLENVRAFLETINGTYLPNKVIAQGTPPEIAEKGSIELLNHRSSIDGKPSVYVCRNFVCDAPVTDPSRLEGLLLS